MSYENWAITIDGNQFDFAPVEVVSWSIAGRDYRPDDADRPRLDGRVFGQDFATPGDIEIELIIRARGATREERYSNAMAIREEFTRVWNGDTVRFTPGAVAELTVAGRSVVEGRPRHVDWDDSRATFGIIRGTALFVRSLPGSFALGPDGVPLWHQVEVGLVQPLLGDIIAPVIAPVTTTVATSRATPFTVGGDSPTYPVLTVEGPLNAGAVIELVGVWSAPLNRGLAYDQEAVIDTRPGRELMTVNGAAVNLFNDTRISKLVFPPGARSLALRGTSMTGTAKVTAMWQTRKDSI